MSIKEKMYKAVMNRVPRVRGFTKKAYFATPFLDIYGENELGEEGARQARDFIIS